MRIRLDAVHKIFADGAVAVHALSLETHDGEFLTLLGPSGCGKSTTLRMLAGLESPTTGDIFFGERRVNDVPPGKRNIAMVFQSYALYPHMTVTGNLEYPLRKAGMARPERERRVRDAAALLQIETLLARKPRQLSGGQQQRVALGRAIVREPELFLLDEPMSNLDAKLRAYMRGELIRLHRRIGKTMIYVTHDQLEAMTMSDRIAVMSQGKLQQLATPAEIYNRPVNRFVAAFIGSPEMNFVDGELVPSGDGASLHAKGLTIALSTAAAAALTSADRQASGRRAVVAGLRPEDVLLGSGPFSAEVTVVEPTGHETLVQLDLSGHGLMARVGAHAAVRTGDIVPVDFRSANIHLFDRATGARIG